MLPISPEALQFIVVTGLSGAGKALATGYFEDFGFRCVDNLPPALIPAFASWCLSNDVRRAAVVADVRSAPRAADHKNFVDELESALQTLRGDGLKPQILFLETDDDRLQKRFKETRRKHPLTDELGDLTLAIAAEREALIHLRERADKIVNTSHVTPRELRQIIEKTFVADAQNPDAQSAQMLVQIESFGFKHGAPSDADLVFDVRFLPNPNYDAQIGHLSGQDQPVIDYVLREPLTQQFQKHLQDFLGFCVPQFEREGKAYLSIAIGCTGGRHRSVVLSNWLAAHLKNSGFRVGISHRDILKPRASQAPTNATISDIAAADIAAADTAISDAVNVDAATSNAATSNAATADATTADAAISDVTTSNAATSNAANANAAVSDARLSDANVANANVADANVADAEILDASDGEMAERG